MLCYAVLCCAVLCCAVLCCAVLCCAVLYCAVLSPITIVLCYTNSNYYLTVCIINFGMINVLCELHFSENVCGAFHSLEKNSKEAL